MSGDPANAVSFAEWFRNGYDTEAAAYVAYHGKLATFFAHRARNNPDEMADDVIFELVRTWTPEKAAKYAEPIKLLFGIAKNLALRRPRPEEPLEDLPEPRYASRPERASNDWAWCADECLAKLTPAERKLIETYKLGEEPISTLAQRMGIEEGALRARVFRIMQRLHENMLDCLKRRAFGDNRSIQ